MRACGGAVFTRTTTACCRIASVEDVAVLLETTFEDCLTSPDSSRLIRATVAFDFRVSSGGLPLTGPLVTRLQHAGEHPGFVRQLGRVTAGYRPPLSFRGHIATDADGRFDIKRGGIIPLVNLARFYALTHGITISGTVDRLRAARDTGVLEAETADELLEAFEIIFQVRFNHHDVPADGREDRRPGRSRHADADPAPRAA